MPNQIDRNIGLHWFCNRKPHGKLERLQLEMMVVPIITGIMAKMNFLLVSPLAKIVELVLPLVVFEISSFIIKRWNKSKTYRNCAKTVFNYKNILTFFYIFALDGKNL